MFDCVDKKSEIKNDTYNYDYKIKTSQNIEKADIEYADNETNYELSEDGKCPLNCKQCLENKKCMKCREGFGLVYMKDEEEIICIQKDELKAGYYINNSIYYKCMDFCEKCENDISCDTCIDNYDYFDNSCVRKIQNCESYLTSEFKSQIFQAILNTNIKATTLKNQFTHHEFPKNKITIILLEVKLKDHQLYLYILIDSYIPKDFSLSIKINIYTQKSLRNLQQEKKEMKLNISLLNCTDSNSFGVLYTFSPEETFKEFLISEGKKTRIAVRNILLNKYNNKNNYNIQMINNSDYLDTAKIEELIQSNQAVDLSLIKNVSIYHFKSISQGCTFELATNEAIKNSDKEINLEFQEINSHKNRSIICSIYRNDNRIECNLDENINSNYTLKNYIEFKNNELFSIISNEENIIPMNCLFELIKPQNGNNSNLSKSSIILIILIPIILIIILVSFICIYLRIKNNKKINPNIDNIGTYSGTTTNVLN